MKNPNFGIYSLVEGRDIWRNSIYSGKIMYPLGGGQVLGIYLIIIAISAILNGIT